MSQVLMACGRTISCFRSNQCDLQCVAVLEGIRSFQFTATFDRPDCAPDLSTLIPPGKSAMAVQRPTTLRCLMTPEWHRRLLGVTRSLGVGIRGATRPHEVASDEATQVECRQGIGPRGGMADASVLGADVRKDVGVRVSPRPVCALRMASGESCREFI